MEANKKKKLSPFVRVAEKLCGAPINLESQIFFLFLFFACDFLPEVCKCTISPLEWRAVIEIIKYKVII